MAKKVRTRFAPSPTGFLHIGSLRAALYAFALAKHSGGDFILRIEDTDQRREVKGAVKALQKTLKLFDLVWDEYYVQSKRVEEGVYKKYADLLLESGNAFYCQCKPKNTKEGYSRELRDPCREKELKEGCIRLKVPDGKTISYYDFVHKKEISWNTDEVYDATLLKTNGFPTYHLAAMVDDLEMKVSHIIRGHDWLPSTPIHLLIFKFLGKGHPEIGHPTDILSTKTGKKLSKRRDSVFVEQFLEEGYLPEAIINFAMLLGWAPKDDRELFSLSEFVEAFDTNGFQRSNPVFNKEKLDWFNQQYIMKTQNSKLKTQIDEFFKGKYQEDMIGKVVPLIKTRIKTLKEFEALAKFFFETPKVDTKLLGKKYKKHLKSAVGVLGKIEDWKLENINDSLMGMIKKNNFSTGKFFMDFRIAITGSKFTPPINESVEILGKEETLSRLKKVLKPNKE